MTATIYKFPTERVRRWPLAGSPDYEWGRNNVVLEACERNNLEAFLTAVAQHGHRWREYL